MQLIPQMEPWFDGNESKALYEYIISGGWVSEFKKTREFEKLLAEFTGATYCAVSCNGTVSLCLALMACEVGPGDEVIVSNYTAVATADAIRLAGASEVFCDIDRESLCLDFESMKNAVTDRTRAVMLATINGRYPARMDDMLSYCRQRGLWLIEDAAQSLGSFRNGRHLGTYGDLGSFSFSAPKVISTGQGGALVTSNSALIGRIRKLLDFGRDRVRINRFTDVQAVIGIEQMKKLPSRLQRTKEIFSFYRELLQGTPGLSFIPTDLTQTSPWFIDILVAHGLRDQLMNHLGRLGIQTRPFYPTLNSDPVYASPANYPVSQRISAQGLWLPSSSRLTDRQIFYICKACKDFLSSPHTLCLNSTARNALSWIDHPE